MTDVDAAAESNRTAIQLQQKFEFYILGLTFTILGLSVQTANFGRNLFADGFELVAWGSLFISGLIGLSRFEQVSTLYDLEGHKQDFDSSARAWQKVVRQGAVIKSLEDGSPVSGEKHVAQLQESKAKVEAVLTPKRDAHARKYRYQRALLVAGLALLMLARAYSPAVRIIVDIWRAVT